MKTKSNNGGFSLVELIVVIAIMAVLVGVLAPTLIGNIEKSRESKDLQNLDSVRQAVQTALANESVYNDIVPAAGTGGAEQENIFTVTSSSAGITAIANGTVVGSPVTTNFLTELQGIVNGDVSPTCKAAGGTSTSPATINIGVKSSGAVSVWVSSTTETDGIAKCEKTKNGANRVPLAVGYKAQTPATT